MIHNNQELEATLARTSHFQKQIEKIPKVNSENWKKLLQVMKSVHEQNRGISEEEVYQDVQRAIDELRQENYERDHNENKTR